MGRVTYEAMADTWPTSTDPGLQLLSSRVFEGGVLALTYRPMTQQELDTIVPAPDTGTEWQSTLDASREKPSR
jgi:hypothetical protein